MPGNFSGDRFVPGLIALVKRESVSKRNVLKKLPGAGGYYCQMCRAVFKSKKHKFVHFPGTYECEVCGKVYGRSDNLALHVKKIHSV